MKTVTRVRNHEASDQYMDLIRAFPLRTLRSDAQHTAAVKVLARLLGRPNGELSNGERDYADVLGRLIEDYGEKEYPFLPQAHSPLEILRYVMQESGMNTESLGKVLGNKTAASLVLNGKRELSKSHIRRLSEHFKLDAGLFF